jgi:hypothetical protein
VQKQSGSSFDGDIEALEKIVSNPSTLIQKSSIESETFKDEVFLFLGFVRSRSSLVKILRSPPQFAYARFNVHANTRPIAKVVWNLTILARLFVPSSFCLRSSAGMEFHS